MRTQQQRPLRQSAQAQTGHDPLALLAGLGLNVDPIQHLGGLVNLVNQLGEGDRWGQEFGLRQQAGDLNAAQLQQQHDQFQQAQDHAAAHEAQAQDNWTQEYGLQKLNSEEARKARLEESQQMHNDRQLQTIAAILGLPSKNRDPITGAMTMDVNPAGLQKLIPADSDFNVMDYFQKQQGGNDPTAGFTDEQKIQYGVARNLGYKK